ncbi:unnamed protein product [Lupinus luteus]|uniref:Uncharacterized protein n=1 Tax=Lupinus luteus TaxID=3873 RepID=A0AAV1W9X5_LUPLU
MDKDKDRVVGSEFTDEFMGRFVFSISDVPIRVPPDSSLAPQWYKLENKHGVKLQGELMISVWMAK